MMMMMMLMMMSMMCLTGRMKLQGVTVILLTASMVASESFLIPELDNKTNDVMKRKSQNSARQYQRELNEVVYLHRVSENSDAELLRELYQGCVRAHSGCQRVFCSTMCAVRQFSCGICKQTWLLLGTNAGRAVATSAYGPVSNVLIFQFLSVFRSRFSFSFLLSRLQCCIWAVR